MKFIPSEMPVWKSVHHFSFPDSSTSNTTPLTASLCMTDTPPSLPSDREYSAPNTLYSHLLQLHAELGESLGMRWLLCTETSPYDVNCLENYEEKINSTRKIKHCFLHCRKHSAKTTPEVFLHEVSVSSHHVLI